MGRHDIVEKLAAAWEPTEWRDVTVLLAVSGGVDSVAMARAMKTLKVGGAGRLAIAHFNHQIRVHDSTKDEAFVSELCGQLGLDFYVGRAAPGQIVGGSTDGVESASRDARYKFLKQISAKIGARYVVTAHTADDQVETIIHRIVRGTGIAGLSGMARARPLGQAVTLIRPLLGLRRAELIEYLNDLGQSYCHDMTNDDIQFTRNRIRHGLLPILRKDFNPNVIDAILRLGSLAGEVQTLVDEIVCGLIDRCVVAREAGYVQIDVGQLAGKPSYAVREFFIAVWKECGWPMQSMGFVQWKELSDLRKLGTGDAPVKKTFPGNILVEVCGDKMLLRCV